MVKVRFSMRAGMAKVGNQGLGDRYIHLQSNRISHPVASELRQSHLITFSTIFQHLISVYKEVMAKNKDIKPYESEPER